MWAAGGGRDELVLAPGWPQESQLQEVTRVSVAQPCLSRPEAHVQPCPLLLGLMGRLLQPLTWPVAGRPACERCAWCRWAGRYPSPPSAALQPWLWPLSCPPGLLGLTPPQRPCHGKACHGRRQEVTGGADQGRADKGGRLVHRVARHQGQRTDSAQKSAGGLLPIMVSGSLSHVCRVPLHSLTHSFTPCAMCWNLEAAPGLALLSRCEGAMRQGRCHFVQPGLPR